MDINDIFEQIAGQIGRPTHPDYWAISSEILRLDAIASEPGFDASTHYKTEVVKFLNLESIEFAVEERARNIGESFRELGAPEDFVHMVEATVMASYYEATIVMGNVLANKAEQEKRQGAS